MKTKRMPIVLCASCREQICKANGPTVIIAEGKGKNSRDIAYCNECGTEKKLSK